MVTGHDIEQGLEQREFCLYYQPKYSLAHAEIVGSEALIRWPQPDGSVRTPAEFIGVATRAALINRISAYNVHRLFEDLGTLLETRFTPVSFNVCASDFLDDSLMRLVLDAIAKNKVAPDRIQIEITETEALHYGDPVLTNIQTLCDAGLTLAMDDYGLGYSSVDTLSKWPFSTIKIDQGLVQRMLISEKNASIVRSAITLAHELGVEAVAEGVETPEQYRFLLEAGCMKVQGYLISKPLALGDVLATSGCPSCPSAVAVGLVHLAIIDHVNWRRRMVGYALRNAILPAAAPERQEPGYPILSADECLIGRWYLTEGQKFAHLPELKELDAAHRTLHALGGDIVHGIQHGAQLSDIDPLIERLHRTSLKLLEMLTLLENYGLVTMYSPTTTH
jgi:EAL domain-containing protein (putative c-di-GMP-specific phosphodiesterase class I)